MVPSTTSPVQSATMDLFSSLVSCSKTLFTDSSSLAALLKSAILSFWVRVSLNSSMRSGFLFVLVVSACGCFRPLELFDAG